MQSLEPRRRREGSANLLHIARLVGSLTLLLVVVTIAGCHLYDDDGKPVPSSNWTWVCDDGSPAPDAGCPDGGDADGGTASGGGDHDARGAK